MRKKPWEPDQTLEQLIDDLRRNYHGLNLTGAYQSALKQRDWHLRMAQQEIERLNQQVLDLLAEKAARDRFENEQRRLGYLDDRYTTRIETVSRTVRDYDQPTEFPIVAEAACEEGRE